MTFIKSLTGIEIETFQNIANLFVCTVVSSTLYSYYYINESYLNYAIPVIVTHFTSDLFLTKKPDLILHHIFGLSFIAYKYIIPVQPPNDISIILVTYKTEISTFFYVFKLFISNIDKETKKKYQTLFQINDLLFFITFFKFRIYDYYSILISNKEMYNDYGKYNYSYFLFFAIHGMYILNIYWFLIICKIALKPFIKILSKKFTDYICYFIYIYYLIVTYICYFGLIIGIYSYNIQPNNRNLYDIFGLFILSIASYNYYNYSYKLIDKNDEINYTDNNTVTLFLQKIGSIHLKSFLAILTNFNFCNIVYLSAFLHTSFYLMNIAHINYIKTFYIIKKDDNPQYNLFILFQYSCLIIPSGLDIILIYLNSIDSVYSIHGFYTSILILMIFIVNPLYDLTHVAFHICLIMQIYFCTKCNMYVISNESLLE
jgi:hypothetical protein